MTTVMEGEKLLAADQRRRPASPAGASRQRIAGTDGRGLHDAIPEGCGRETRSQLPPSTSWSKRRSRPCRSWMTPASCWAYCICMTCGARRCCNACGSRRSRPLVPPTLEPGRAQSHRCDRPASPKNSCTAFRISVAISLAFSWRRRRKCLLHPAPARTLPSCACALLPLRHAKPAAAKRPSAARLLEPRRSTRKTGQAASPSPGAR